MRPYLRPLLTLGFVFGMAPAGAADGPRLTTEVVQRVIAAAVARAGAIKVPMGISVVDAGGNLVGFVKMEGAFVHTHHTSFAKAYTAASVRRPTHETGIPAPILSELGAVTQGRLTGLPGGYPLVLDGRVIGGIGVGGGNAEQDMDVARAGAAASAPPR
ncbi:GlcG/HbpS family heme-binding protein [Sulfurifustis variabilis]|nr:heme-binding protein [Sulfurifustis variabilis]